MTTRAARVVVALVMVGVTAGHVSPPYVLRTPWAVVVDQAQRTTFHAEFNPEQVTDTVADAEMSPPQVVAHALGGLVVREVVGALMDGTYSRSVAISHDGAQFTVRYLHLERPVVDVPPVSKDFHLHFEIRGPRAPAIRPMITVLSPHAATSSALPFTIRGAGFHTGIDVSIEGSAQAMIRDTPIASTAKPLIAASYLVGSGIELSIFGKQGTGGTRHTPNQSDSGSAATATLEFESGRIVVLAPARMKVAEPQKVFVRVAREHFSDLQAEHRTVLGLAPTLAHVNTGRYMAASLLTDEQNFRVLPVSTSSQIVERPGVTQWVWVVTPLRSGLQELHVLLRLHYSLSEPASRDVFVGNRVVHVDRNLAHSASEFATSNWIALFSLPFIAGGFGLVTRSVRRRRRAGFSA